MQPSHRRNKVQNNKMFAFGFNATLIIRTTCSVMQAFCIKYLSVKYCIQITNKIDQLHLPFKNSRQMWNYEENKLDIQYKTVLIT